MPLEETVVLMIEELLEGTVEWLLEVTVDLTLLELLTPALDWLLDVTATDEEVLKRLLLVTEVVGLLLDEELEWLLLDTTVVLLLDGLLDVLAE